MIARKEATMDIVWCPCCLTSRVYGALHVLRVACVFFTCSIILLGDCIHEVMSLMRLTLFFHGGTLGIAFGVNRRSWGASAWPVKYRSDLIELAHVYACLHGVYLHVEECQENMK